MTRLKRRSFVATVTRDGARWCARILGQKDVFAQGDSLGETAERLRWLLTACLNTDRREFHPAQVEITLVFSPDKHLDDCCG